VFIDDGGQSDLEPEKRSYESVQVVLINSNRTVRDTKVYNYLASDIMSKGDDDLSAYSYKELKDQMILRLENLTGRIDYDFTNSD
jgi:hypothetical protein